MNILLRLQKQNKLKNDITYDIEEVVVCDAFFSIKILNVYI